MDIELPSSKVPDGQVAGPHSGDGTPPIPTATNAWAVTAYQLGRYPCENCWRLGRTPRGSQVKNSALCESCRTARRELLRSRQQWFARHKAPVPPMQMSGSEVQALDDAHLRLTAATTFLSVPAEDVLGTSTEYVSDMVAASQTIVELLREPLKRVRVLSDLERRGLLPPFMTKTPRRGQAST